MLERPREKYYRDTARFYDAFAERPDETFYLELAKRFGSPILELACGTGRITSLLHKQVTRSLELSFLLRCLGSHRKNYSNSLRMSNQTRERGRSSVI